MYANPAKKQAPRPLIQTVVALLISLWSLSAYSSMPAIAPIQDITIKQGETLKVSPQLVSKKTSSSVNWSKAYGHDSIQINPVTGEVTWAIPADLPGESFYLGIQASSPEGLVIEPVIIHVGVPDVVYIGPNESAKDFHNAFAAWKNPGKQLRTPGTTFVVRDGQYSGTEWLIGLTGAGFVQHPPPGTAAGFTTIMAENPGQVTLHSGAGISASGNFGGVAYWAIKGFYMDGGHLAVNGVNCSEVSCQPHHIKFIGNGINLKHEGSSFGASHANHLLFENNYSFGGHRTKFSAYRTNNVIFRRNLGRFDHNEIHTGPTNTFSFYTSIDVLAQNNIAIDADQQEFIASGEQAGEFGCPTTGGPSKARWDRNIQLNSDMLHANIDKQGGNCYALIRDSIGWDNRSPGAFIMTRSPSLFDHATFGAIKPEDPPLVIFNGWPSHFARGITNTVLHDIQSGPLFEGFLTGTTEGFNGKPIRRFGIDTVNISAFDGELKRKQSNLNTATFSHVDPIWSKTNPKGGLRYLVRMEPHSNLSNKAADGTDLGARVMTFKGKSGTLWGEPGFDQETGVRAWPFPMQKLMADKMRALEHTGPTWTGTWRNRKPGPVRTLSGDRGFAKASTNLTDYIWGYLGSSVPPFNVSATQAIKRDELVLRWDPVLTPDLLGYKVYRYDKQTQTISAGKSVGLETTYKVKKPEAGKHLEFVVTALSKSKGESSWSYPASLTN